MFLEKDRILFIAIYFITKMRHLSLKTPCRINKSDLLFRIAQYLLVNGSFINSLGLLTGKMGIVIFFCHYSRHANNAVYEEFAGELLDEIYEEIHNETPISFADGLCGIAWGILHLIENGFVDADPDEVLSDIDQAIMKYDVRKITDTSLSSGLLGVAHYVFRRKNIDSGYLQELTENMEFQNLKKPDLNSLLKEMVENIEINEDLFELENPLLGIENGIVGIGLKLIWANNEQL